MWITGMVLLALVTMTTIVGSMLKKKVKELLDMMKAQNQALEDQIDKLHKELTDEKARTESLELTNKQVWDSHEKLLDEHRQIYQELSLLKGDQNQADKYKTVANQLWEHSQNQAAWIQKTKDSLESIQAGLDSLIESELFDITKLKDYLEKAKTPEQGR